MTATDTPASFSPRWIALSVLLDVVAVIVFVTIGRINHEEGFSFGGFWSTLWPFLAGWAVAALVSTALTVSGRTDWSLPRLFPAGILCWVGTIVIGMLLRWADGQGIAASFVIVASFATGVLLLGWRLLAAQIGRGQVNR